MTKTITIPRPIIDDEDKSIEYYIRIEKLFGNKIKEIISKGLTQILIFEK